jgi:hypothetical protein
MSSSGHPNDDAGSYHQDLELHYHQFFLKSSSQTRQDSPLAANDHEMEDAAGGTGDETSDATGGSGAETSGAAGAGGDETSGATGSSATGTSGTKRPRKAWRPNTVATCRDTVREVDPKSDSPIEPKDVARGYDNQLAEILREVINLNETDLQGKNKNH